MRGALPFALIVSVLLLPKLCALAVWMMRARGVARRLVFLRAGLIELVVSTLVAPLIMLRQSGAVASVLIGRDCGWKSGKAPRRALPKGLPEALAGLALLALAVAAGPAAAVWWLAPVALPLVAAPVLVPVLDGAA